MMRDLEFPTNDIPGTHAALTGLVRRALDAGLRPGVLVLQGRERPTGDWRSVLGRIDLAKSVELRAPEVLPKGNVRVLYERVEPETFSERLAAALAGGSFQVLDQAVADHGMAGAWGAAHHTKDWRSHGCDWPCVVAAPREGIRNRPRVDELVEADGPIGVFERLDEAAWSVARFLKWGGHHHDPRIGRFQIVIWDHRGRIDDVTIRGAKATVGVTPPGDPSLRLVGVVKGKVRSTPVVVHSPARVEVGSEDAIASATLELRCGDELLAEHRIEPVHDVEDGSTSSFLELADDLDRPGSSVAGDREQKPAPMFGSWRIVRHLDQGGQGVAHVAQHATTSESGVIKVLREDKLLSTKQRDKAVGRFRREVEILGKLNHAFVLKVIDSDVASETPWVVTEFMTMGSLYEHVGAFRGDAWRTLRLVRHVAIALELLHAKQLVHRDVKPKNIFLRSLDHPVLGDFGVVHDSAGTEFTSIGEGVGTGWFAPPEALGGRFDDPPPNFDLYSLGKVLWVLMTGREKRFQREDFRSEEHDLVRVLRRSDLEPINRLLDRLVVADPAGRFQRADELVSAIDATVAELFGRRQLGRCRHCGVADYERKGTFALRAEGLESGTDTIQALVETCPNCGDLRMLQQQNHTQSQAAPERRESLGEALLRVLEEQADEDGRVVTTWREIRQRIGPSPGGDLHLAAIHLKDDGHFRSQMFESGPDGTCDVTLKHKT